jgi:phage recombination protein Bet
MSKELATTQSVQESDLIGYLDTLGLTSKLNENEKKAYLNIAKAFNLNPFKREIHVSKYGEQMSIITGYEVYIKRAERTGQLDGWNATTTGSLAGNDLKAVVTIYRKDRSHPFVWEALYEECVQTTKEGKPTKFWQKAAFMTKKVAISQAFRLCFSDELEGMPYTADEMPQQEQQTEDVPHVEVKPLSPMKIGSKVFNSGVTAMREGKTFEQVEQVANGAGWSIPEEVKTALLDAVEVAA